METQPRPLTASKRGTSYHSVQAAMASRSVSSGNEASVTAAPPASATRPHLEKFGVITGYINPELSEPHLHI